MNRYSENNVTELCELTLLGVNAAYEELVRRYENAVKQTAFSLSKDEYIADRSSQNAFLSAWIELNTLENFENYETWVCSIVKKRAESLMKKHCRDEKKSGESDLEDNEFLYEYFESNTQLATLFKIWDRGRDDEIHKIVDSMTGSVLTAFNLHYCQNLSAEEISKQLSLPVKTVKKQIAEARDLFRTEYGIYESKQKKLSFIQRVMSDIESLCNTDEKIFAAADAPSDYWWLSEEIGKKTVLRIKEHAEKEHNDEVMLAVVKKEIYDGKDMNIPFVLQKEIPYLTEQGFTRVSGCVFVLLGCEYGFQKEENVKALEAFKQALSLLEEKDVYYSFATAGIKTVKSKIKNKVSELFRFGICSVHYKLKDGKAYRWEELEYNYKCGSAQFNEIKIFYDSLSLDNIKVGDPIIVYNDEPSLICIEKNIKVDTPAKSFENCMHFKFNSDQKRFEAYHCSGVGIVKVVAYGNTFVLNRYTLCEEDGFLPFAKGNRWEYLTCKETSLEGNFCYSFEVVYADDEDVTISVQRNEDLLVYKKESWKANILEASYAYYNFDNDNKCHLHDVSDCFSRAEALAETKREKIHTAIAKNVMDRIFKTDNEINPDYTEKGVWNFFDKDFVCFSDTGSVILQSCDYYSFAYKELVEGEFGRMVYNFPYSAINFLTGCVWTDEWVPNYRFESPDFNITACRNAYVLEVFPDETVFVPAGIFKNCRHIHIKAKNCFNHYLDCDQEYFFAPGVGLVKYIFNVGSIWELTKYTGTGEGYFPVGDGFFRRYDPKFLFDGYHAFVEYTFDEDESGIALFRNAAGTQDRKDYEEMMSKKTKEKKKRK